MTRRQRNTETPLVYTVKESAAQLRIRENTMYAWIKAGVVRSVVWHSTTLVPKVELDRLIADAMANGGTPPGLERLERASGGAG